MVAAGVWSLKIVCACLCALQAVSVTFARSFSIDYDNNTFVKDGKPFRYISGSIHYSRVPYQYWDDRLHKMAAAGLNAIQTYVPWNIHEPMYGVYDFSDQQDIVKFLQTAQKYNLSVILRPGPYICAEWEFGGLPAWLLKQDGLKVRTMDSTYITYVDTWLTKLYTVLKPLLYKNGGPIITVQVENEYGSYPACDYKYLGFLRDIAKKQFGDDVVLFTTDGDGVGYLKCGTLPDVYSTVDFGVTYNPEKNFAVQRKYEPKGPLVNSEFYTGWLDHWGKKHSTTDAAAVAKSLDLMLALGANVNMYMFEGGTNFAFWNGANYPYSPQPTSYDYDAPLSEAGDITAKYHTLKQVITKYNRVSMKVPPSTPKAVYGRVNLTVVDSLVAMSRTSANSVTTHFPVSVEMIDHYYGYSIYGHTFNQGGGPGILDLSGVRDRGYVTLLRDGNMKMLGVVDRVDKSQQLNISIVAKDTLYIVVENQGRINYGGQMNNNRKGLISNVTFNGFNLTDWTLTPVNLAAMISSFVHVDHPMMPGMKEGPMVFVGLLDIPGEPEDTYLDMRLWTKGNILVNGHNMGRYWPKKGPQVRLYIPKHVLLTGINNIVLVELEMNPCNGTGTSCYIEFMDTPLINGTVTLNT